MSRRGRPAKDGYRTNSGQLTRSRAAFQPDEVISAQPHRRPFAALLGDGATSDYRAAFALGRLRMIGEAEARRHGKLSGIEHVRRVLYGGHRDAPEGPFGISDRQFWAGMKYLEAVGRERWVRASPKDKPSAVAFMSARGIDLSARELSSAEASRYVAEFEDVRAALMAAIVPPDAQRVLRVCRERTRRLRKSGASGSDELLRLLQGLGALMNPAGSAMLVALVNRVVIDDRDPQPAELPMVMRGLDAIADQVFGPERDERRPIKGVVHERPTWEHEAKEALIVYPDGKGGTRPAHQEPQRDVRWKTRHRSHAGA